MADHFLREYGVATTVPFALYEYDDGKDFRVDAVHASGDVKIMKDEGAEATHAAGFTDEGTGYAIPLAIADMQAARIVLYVADQGSKAWLDKEIIIETFGHASAQFPDRIMPASLSSAERLAMADAVWDEVMEGTKTARQFMRGVASALFSRVSGMAAGAPIFRDVDNTKNRITATTDADGNRTSVTTDLT